MRRRSPHDIARPPPRDSDAVQLTREQESWLAGAAGPSLQWATRFNQGLGDFFGAETKVPVASHDYAITVTTRLR